MEALLASMVGGAITWSLQAGTAARSGAAAEQTYARGVAVPTVAGQPTVTASADASGNATVTAEPPPADVPAVD